MNGVWFDDKHSYKDYGMYLSSKEVGLPSVKTQKVSVNGMDGVIDLSDTLTGRVSYDNRKRSFTFSVVDKKDRYFDILATVTAHLHGKRMKIVLDEDDGYYYVGRVSVNKFKSMKSYYTIEVEADAEPFKYEKALASDTWLWDPFDFRTGIAQSTSYVVDGTLDVTIYNTTEVVCPEFTATERMEIVFDGTTYVMQAGTKKFYDIVFTEGKNEISFNGSGKVDVVFRRGRL